MAVPLSLECKPARRYALENIDGSLAYLLVKTIPDTSVMFGSLPLNIGILIDVSASMKGDKINYARDASKYIVQSLSPEDLISIVIFSDDAKVLVSQGRVENAEPILKAIDKIRPASGTRMFKGMEAAIAELHRNEAQSHLNLLLLLTDGETEGEMKCLALAKEAAQIKTMISTFGIGPSYNEELLKMISDSTMGNITHLQSPEQIIDHFHNEVSFTRTTSITNVTMQIQLGNNVKLGDVHRIFPNSTRLNPVQDNNNNSYTLNINSLSSTDTSLFGIKMNLPSRKSGPVTEAVISVQYDVPNLGIRGNTDKCQVTIEYTGDRNQCTEFDREVLNYFNQINVEGLISQAVNETKAGNVAAATKILNQAQMLTQKVGNPALTSYINNATVELNKHGTISAEAMKTMKVGASHTVKIEEPGIQLPVVKEEEDVKDKMS